MHKLAAIAEEDLRPLRRVEYDKLVSLGAFDGERIELVYGVLRQMSPIGPPHTSSVGRITRLLVLALAKDALVLVQCPFAASDLSEPEPDFTVVPLADYQDDHPHEAFLVVEVSQSSLRYDRGTKQRLYAEAGVPEYWIVNLVDRTLEVYAEPRDGSYCEVRILAPGERIAPRAFPHVEFGVDELLPPSRSAG
ncbi:MAG: Uma2 family endonuclease [Polyangiaceae bacterium]